METRAQDPQRASLLLLEDDWDHRNVFRDFLVHRGWTVLEATQAASARSLLASERIDVVVVDLGGTNGWALLEELGTKPGRPHLLCLTGDARTESRDQAVALGADQYLVKPIALKRLADAVERLVGARPFSHDQPAPARPARAPSAAKRAPRRRTASGSAAATRTRPAPPDPHPTPTTEPTPRERPMVLLLEDDDDARAIYRDMLDFAGYDVVAACDGVEGLRYAEACTPDIVVTDLHMPGMSGVEVARTLREESGALPAIIAVTADSLGVSAAKERLGELPLFDEVLVKPVSPGELVRTVRAYVPAPEDDEG
jgi:DNA-binding response OmpR family regulator